MIAEVYDAFRAAEGVGEERARKAAEAVAAFDQQFVSLERKMEGRFATVDQQFAALERRIDQRFAAVDQQLAALERRVDQRFAAVDVQISDIRGTLRTMQWMLATIVAGVAALVIRTFT